MAFMTLHGLASLSRVPSCSPRERGHKHMSTSRRYFSRKSCQPWCVEPTIHGRLACICMYRVNSSYRLPIRSGRKKFIVLCAVLCSQCFRCYRGNICRLWLRYACQLITPPSEGMSCAHSEECRHVFLLSIIFPMVPWAPIVGPVPVAPHIF
ncbi:hypothetical protein F5I97DRAFT_1446987 [Phlebopus sp. FC_14]|nr:hypothetical protein F5I97DRAFT_1446987 [Phlebopus sp. FC_14]